MDVSASPVKKLKSSGAVPPPINVKTSITCTSVPDGLFEQNAAKKHFVKFGRVQRIRLFPKRQMCIVEYDQPSAVERALLNAGAFDGFMFDVTRTKQRLRKHSKREDDPDWVPDSDVEEELSALGRTPIYRLSRQKKMEVESEVTKPNLIKRVVKQSPLKKQIIRERPTVVAPVISGIESPVVAVTSLQTSLSTSEAAAELNQLRGKVSMTPDEKWRTLDARDKILRSWGGAGSRVKVGGATIGTCPDMCPEKELLHRQAEYQVMTLETYPDSDGVLDPTRAVKQYSRSSADQEIPMCYELRPANILMKTCTYLLKEVADTNRQVSLADWFHFMWDRFRSIRKDITQQALCCSESIQLVEMCARFHAHCAARLADLEHTQFDQKLNTDNLTKCLQTLKHMYADVGPEKKPREAEFRGYIALLNLGDSNFWWEIKQLPIEIQKSDHIVFAMKIFNALDNNNYVKFFRLIKEKATYLQACILLRYFNDVRARALARIVKAYAPRGGSKYPAEELMNSLAFESVESMISYITHYGLQLSKIEDSELGIILDRNQFIEDSDPYPISRAMSLIESKRKDSVGNIIAGGGSLLSQDFSQISLYSSFTKDGKLKESALIAEDVGYNTLNDSNKDVKTLKAEIIRIMHGSKNFISSNATPKSLETPRDNNNDNSFAKSEVKVSYGKSRNPFLTVSAETNNFSFTPAIPVASLDIMKKTPEKTYDSESKTLFSFSKPQESPEQETENIFKVKTMGNKVLNSETTVFKNVSKIIPQNLHPEIKASIFGTKTEEASKNVFGNIDNNNIFAKKDEISKNNLNLFAKASGSSIFTKTDDKTKLQSAGSIFGQVNKDNNSVAPSIFGSKPEMSSGVSVFKKPDVFKPKFTTAFTSNGEVLQNCTSPGTLFKSAIAPTQNGSNTQTYSIFQSKNKVPSVADNISNSVPANEKDVYEFNQSDDEIQMKRMIEEKIKKETEEAKLCEQIKLEQERQLEIARKEEEERQELQKKKLEELKRIKQQQKKEEEEKRQNELRKKIEEQKQAELKRKAEEDKRKAEEDKRKFKEQVEKESNELIFELCDEITDETVKYVVKSEMDLLKQLILNAESMTEEILKELCHEISIAETKAEKFWTDKLCKKWFSVWKKHAMINVSRRNLLDDTPVWLTGKTALVEASCLKRQVEKSALKNMMDIHMGYRFSGEPKRIPSPEPYNIMEIIRSPLLKRMRHINYPYDKCFFWKITVVAPVANKWLYRKVEIQQWIKDAFGDAKNHQISETLINVGLQSWNNLMDFAISVSLITNESESEYGEALEGSNGALFYSTENDETLFENIKKSLVHKYPYQIVPIAIILAETVDLEYFNKLDKYLVEKVHKNIISAYKIFIVKKDSLAESLYTVTKSALKWIAKKYPSLPTLEIDYLKSLCQQYLANEFWCRLRTDRDTRMQCIVKDMPKVINCYNSAVDKLTEVLTNEDLYNHPIFPLEFKTYLNLDSPYPKPYEFIPSNVRTSDNASAIKDAMKHIKLPESNFKFQPKSVSNMQEQIRSYCKQIGWFENSEEVACKVIALLPSKLTDHNISYDYFTQQFEQYELIDFLNVIVYEKICKIKSYDNLFAIYDKTEMEQYRNLNWLYNIDVISKLKHKALKYEDDIDILIDAKRRKIAAESMECLMLEDRDKTVVEDNVKVISEKIMLYSNCTNAVQQLEKQIEEEKIKSLHLEMLLQSALSDM